jgi:hypothetical protein
MDQTNKLSLFVSDDPDWRPSAEKLAAYRESSKPFYPKDPRVEIKRRQEKIALHEHYAQSEELSTWEDPNRKCFVMHHRYWIAMHKAVIEAIVLETITS